jgi:hypothetical protein
MKLRRSLFQVVPLVLFLAIFSDPLRADMSSPVSTGAPLAHSATAGKFKTLHHMFLIVLDNAESGFMGGIVPVLALLFAARAISLALMPAPRVKVMVEEPPPVEIPPLRPLPERITLF